MAQDEPSVLPGPAAPIPPRYEIRGFLGEGSSAIVYRAWDTELRRSVALKVLRETSDFNEIVRQRFRREAHAAAQITHPNVVSVFDAGEHAGRLYLVLELVEGKSLQDRLSGAALERNVAIDLVEKVARGVAAAHARGIVHRDLKPGNILIAPSGEPKVGDFGLAQLPDATRGLTREGAILGTPLYMSPEQVEGREASARTDVYALGAILYQLLVGRPPHASDRVPEIYRKIVREDPVPPRAFVPDLPADLETIVLKALQQDPAHRYVDAGAFADDLRRQRDGRSVEARPESKVSRVYRSLRRHRPLALGGLGLAAFLAVLAVSWRVNVAKEEQLQRERGEALENLRQTARISVDAALRLRRAGDAAGMKRFLPPLEDAYARASRLAPGTPEADYLLGRMHRALMNDRKALDHQGRAIEKDPDYGPAIYERVVLQARRFDSLFRAATESMRAQAIHRLTTPNGRPSRLPTRVEVEQWRPEIRVLRESIITDCEQLRRLMGSPRRADALRWIGDANTLAADGILAYCEQRYEDGRKRLEEAVQLEAQLEEAWEALARVLEGQETAAGSAGEKEALRRESERIHGDAIFLDQAYLPFYLGRGNMFMRSSVAKFRSGKDPLADQAAAEKDFAECVKIDPEHAEAWQRLGAVRLDRGRYLVNRGRDPLPDWTQAEKDFDRSLSLRRDLLLPWIKRGFLLSLRGAQEASVGSDPQPSWERSERDLLEALRVQTANTDPWLRLGILRTSRGLWEQERNRDPLLLWKTAELNLSEALRLTPGYSEALTRRGALRFHRGLYRSAKGENPSADWEAAELDLTEALDSEDLSSETRTQRGIVRMHRGLRLLKDGGDPLSFWERAEEDFRLVAAEGSDYAASHQGRGELAWHRAAFLEGGGTGAKQAYALCAREYAEAIRINPRLEPSLEARRQEARIRSGP